MMDGTYKRFAPLGVALGIGGLVVAAVIWLLQRQFDAYVQSSLAAAALGFALAILLNPGAVQTWLSGRQARYGGNVLVMTLAFIGIVGLVNYLAVKNPKQWDFTEDKVNTLAPETLEALAQLPEPVTAIGFYSTNFAGAQAQSQSLLERYKVEAGGKLSYEFHDPIGEPGVARQYGITRDGTLVLVMGAHREELSFATEQEITAALIRFSHPTTRVIYFLTGHGERNLTAADETGITKAVDLLRKQNYEVKPLNLQVTTTVPADARAVVIAGPLVPVTADEVAVLDAYMRGDARSALIVLLDPPIQTQAGLDQAEPLVEYLTREWGIRMPPDVVVDLYNSYPRQPLFPLNSNYEPSPITTKLQNISTVFPVARSLVLDGAAETRPEVVYTPLVKTDGRAWGETDYASLEAATGPDFGDGDTPGPLTLGLAAENAAAKARLIVYGDSDFASNGAADQGANAQLFVNSLNWAATEESLINLTPKIPTTRTVILTDALTVNLIFLITVIVMPLAVVGLGVVTWFLRRRHV